MQGHHFKALGSLFLSLGLDFPESDSISIKTAQNHLNASRRISSIRRWIAAKPIYVLFDVGSPSTVGIQRWVAGRRKPVKIEDNSSFPFSFFIFESKGRLRRVRHGEELERCAPGTPKAERVGLKGRRVQLTWEMKSPDLVHLDRPIARSKGPRLAAQKKPAH